MTGEELKRQYETFKSDVSGLVNTGATGQLLGKRIEKNADGKYVLIPNPKVENKEDRMKIILGAVKPALSADSIISFHRDLFDYSIDEEVLACRPLSRLRTEGA